jgi:hypothetical protein
MECLQDLAHWDKENLDEPGRSFDFTGPRRLARTEDNFGTTASATVRP